MAKPMGTFKTDKKAEILSRNIAEFHNRGFASAEKVQTVLNIIKNETEITHLKHLDETKTQEIAQEIAERVHNGEIQATTGADYFSVLNMIADYTNHFFNKEINNLHYSEYFSKSIDYSNKSISQETHENFQNFLSERFENTGDTRFQALELATELQREFGLRFRESAGLYANTIEKALETNKLELSREDWTKNAREREISIRTEEQRQLLQNVKNFLDGQQKVNLAGADNYKDYNSIASFRSFADSQRQEFLSNTGEQYNFHGERHAWAQERYSQLWEEKTGVRIEAPIKYYSEQLQQAGWDGEGKFYDAIKEYDIKPFWDYVQETIAEKMQEELNFPDIVDMQADNQAEHDHSKLLEMPEPEFDIFQIDKEIRLEISSELGHNRLDITNTYLGHA